jgi:hypothetical protein
VAVAYGQPRRALGRLMWAGMLFGPTLVLAQTTKGLVPCGNPTGAFNGYTPAYFLQATSCNICYLAVLIQEIVNFLIMVAIPISVAMFAWAGIMYFTSAGNPKNIGRAHKIFSGVFWGFIIALSGWLLVQVALQAITSSDYSPSSFFNLSSCQSLDNQRPRNESIGNVLSGNGLVSGGTGPGQQTGGTGTPGPSATNNNPIDDTQARQMIADYNDTNSSKIDVKSGVSFTGVNQDLLQGVISDVSGAPGGIQITSANDSQHGGTSQHGAGNAIDISPSAAFTSYMETNFTKVTNPIDPSQPAYRDPSGNIWSKEVPGSTAQTTGTHWHVSPNGR